MTAQGLIDKQARQFTYYLIKKEPSKLEIDLYKRALANNEHNPNSKDKRILDFVGRHTWSIGLIDSSTALTDPNSEIRRRLLIMFSILECMPERYDQFIPKRHSRWYWSEILFTGLGSVLKAASGIVLVKIID